MFERPGIIPAFSLGLSEKQAATRAGVGQLLSRGAIAAGATGGQIRSIDVIGIASKSVHHHPGWL
jgi:hypothetical protein